MKSRSKKPTSRKSKRARKGKMSTEKGRLLEEIAARMYKSSFHDVILNARVSPVNRNPKLKPEIDVLLQSKVVTRPARRAIECKNLSEKVGLEKINAFVGKLQDVGVPYEHGVYISSRGYTEDAIDRSKPINLKLLTLTGLTEDGLASITAEAFQLRVFYLARVEEITITNNLEKIDKGWELLIFFDEKGNFRGTVADLLWNQWQAGLIPMTAGKHEINMVVPKGWRQIVNGKEEPILAATASLTVFAFVLRIPGESTYHTLIRATDGTVEKRQLNATFNVNVDRTVPQTLEVFDSEDDLKAAVQSQKGVGVTIRTRLPRIQYMNRFYYPLSKRVDQLLKQRWEQASDGIATPDDLNIDEIEGTDLTAVFEPLLEGYPGKRVPVIVYEEKQGTVVDVSGLLQAGDYRRVVECEKNFRRHPRRELGTLLHDANLIYAEKLLESAASLPRGKALRIADRARKKVLNALTFNPRSRDAHHDLGIVLQEMGRHQEAVQSFDTALVIVPDEISTLNLKAMSLRELSRYDDALAVYDRILALQSDHLEALFYRSGLLGAVARYEESAEGYDSVLKMVPAHYESLYYRGLSLYNVERYRDSIESFTQALQVRPAEFDVLLYRAMAFERTGRNEEALRDYNLVIAGNANKHELYINRGSVLQRLGRYNDALADLDHGLKHDPDNTVGWNNRGNTLSGMGRFEEALESYDRVVQIEPTNRMALTNRGITLSTLGRLEEALVSFDHALKIEPDHLPTLHSKGLALYRLGRSEEALIIYDCVLAVDPKAEDTLANKALALADLKRLNEALDTANAALKSSPQTDDRAMLFAIRAKVRYLMSHLEDVAPDIVEAWKIDPNLILTLRECHPMFIESFKELSAPSEDESKLYVELAVESERRVVSDSGGMAVE
jgi:tetratricopeptide (TPR) repeat protein